MIFAAPLALAAPAWLPPLFFILRLPPPAPRRLRFPPIALLRDLSDTESTPDRLPLWMLLFRLLAAALLIIGFAGPRILAATHRRRATDHHRRAGAESRRRVARHRAGRDQRPARRDRCHRRRDRRAPSRRFAAATLAERPAGGRRPCA